MDEEKRVRFVQVTKKEALRRFGQLADTHSQLRFWVKGDTNRFSTVVTKFNSESLEWVTQISVDSSLPEKVYFHFAVSGTEYFGRAFTKKNEASGVWRFLISENLYKSELRAQERLLVYPHVQVFFEIPRPPVDADNLENVLDFGRRKQGTQTDLMLKFLDLVGGHQGDVEMKLKSRVLDISKNGLAIMVNKEIQKFFPPGSNFPKTNIYFDNTIYQVELVGVQYRKHVKSDPFIGREHFRIGIKFLKFDVSEKSNLEKKIQEYLKKGDNTSDFELFRSKN